MSASPAAIDACADGRHGCEHQCVSARGSYSCRCRAGYYLNQDKRTCTSTCPSPSLLLLPFLLHLLLAHPPLVPQYVAPSLANIPCPCSCWKQGQSASPALLCCHKQGPGPAPCRSGTHRAPLPASPCLLLSPVIDYCSFGNHSCQHECVSIPSGHRCRCHRGFMLQPDGSSCRGESRGMHKGAGVPCSHRGNPVPLPCPPATDLCNGVDHGCKFKCVTSEGSYHCVCPEGQQLQADGKGCSREYWGAAHPLGCSVGLLGTQLPARASPTWAAARGSAWVDVGLRPQRQSPEDTTGDSGKGSGRGRPRRDVQGSLGWQWSSLDGGPQAFLPHFPASPHPRGPSSVPLVPSHPAVCPQGAGLGTLTW